MLVNGLPDVNSQASLRAIPSSQPLVSPTTIRSSQPRHPPSEGDKPGPPSLSCPLGEKEKKSNREKKQRREQQAVFPRFQLASPFPASPWDKEAVGTAALISLITGTHRDTNHAAATQVFVLGQSRADMAYCVPLAESGAYI
ncbi:uncharacterized protein MCYG_07790 [Microsporum canis CBS 113480]|uniref:Uncharacterized protein n=1 Tax=Arthroderma otae (strain ATCC MYA-4605 / CBS 113480) TaxID=554155 RepID=C5FXD1_ARTOC|nr:uncharacterized protein MCYG_07790 [Microsporum canis CBS 113480]EEQ34971.1 predicted protein [Microsporum canis CBS 113480]